MVMEKKMKQLSDCCKAEIKLTGSPEHKDAFACAKCGRIIGTPIKKQKPKELDYLKEYNEWVETTGLVAKGTSYYYEIESIIENALTQQRTEIESQKVKVVWNNVCEQIKQEARTELLEEIKSEKSKHTPNSGAGRVLTQLLIKLKK